MGGGAGEGGEIEGGGSVERGSKREVFVCGWGRGGEREIEGGGGGSARKKVFEEELSLIRVVCHLITLTH